MFCRALPSGPPEGSKRIQERDAIWVRSPPLPLNYGYPSCGLNAGARRCIAQARSADRTREAAEASTVCGVLSSTLARSARAEGSPELAQPLPPHEPQVCSTKSKHVPPFPSVSLPFSVSNLFPSVTLPFHRSPSLFLWFPSHSLGVPPFSFGFPSFSFGSPPFSSISLPFPSVARGRGGPWNDLTPELSDFAAGWKPEPQDDLAGELSHPQAWNRTKSQNDLTPKLSHNYLAGLSVFTRIRRPPCGATRL